MYQRKVNKCRARAVKCHLTNKVTLTKDHNHTHEAYDRPKECLKQQIFAVAKANPEKGAKRVFEDVRRECTNTEAQKITFPTIESTINRRRKTNLPPLPKTLAEFSQLIKESTKYQKYHLVDVYDDDGNIEAILGTVEKEMVKEMAPITLMRPPLKCTKNASVSWTSTRTELSTKQT